MRIFDLHNDALTAGGSATDDDVIYAVWTTCLNKQKVFDILDGAPDRMIAIEDCGIFADDISSLISRRKIMYAGLTWNHENDLAGGTYSSERLKLLGKDAVRILNTNNIVVDTAHLNEASFYDVIEIADNVICSHTCFNYINDHPRNLTCDQISAIISKGGIIGLCLVSDFLGGNTIDDVIRHIDWFLSHFGDKNLSIGTDFYGTSDLPKDLGCYKDFDKLTLAMIKRGYSDATIHRILYENAAAYFSERY